MKKGIVGFAVLRSDNKGRIFFKMAMKVREGVRTDRKHYKLAYTLVGQHRPNQLKKWRSCNVDGIEIEHRAIG